MTELEKAFIQADEDSKGEIEKEKIEKLIKQLGCYPNEAFNKMFEDIDTRGLEKLDFNGFIELLRKVLAPPSEEILKERFELFDKSSDGCLTRYELQKVLKQKDCNVSNRFVTMMMQTASTTNDTQKITFSEFVAMAQRPRTI